METATRKSSSVSVTRARTPRAPAGPGVLVYDPRPGSASTPLAFTRHVIDNGGVGTEDLVSADLDGDGRDEIVAGGRSTHNVRIYWNRAKK